MAQGSTHGYIAIPADRARAGVVLVHDWYGLLPGVRAYAQELARHGFMAVAPDLYDGHATTAPEEAERLLDALDRDHAQQHLSAAVEHVDRAVDGNVGMVGWSMGGVEALEFAARHQVAACVVYVAALHPERDVSIACPVLAHLAEVDDWDPADLPETFFAGLDKAELIKYPGTEHSFATRDAKQFHQRAASQAWERTLVFLKKHS